MFKLLQGM